MKKKTTILLVLLLAFLYAFPCHATQDTDTDDTDTIDTEETTEHAETSEYPNEPARQPDLVSNAAIVIDAATGQVLYEKNASEKKYPASITKIMTTLIALEHDVDFDATVTMSQNAIWGIDRESTHIGLDVGEQVTVGDLIYATMLNSANECAYALAEYVAGDIETFANLMNERAAQIGCKNTHFVTPNGLHDKDHYTTAYDMALIAREAIKNEAFRNVAGTLSYTIPPTNKTEEERPLWNKNKMIKPTEPYYYEYCEGGKEGYTTDANNTLMTFAKKDGLELICVVLDCDGFKYAYTDSKALYNYCYNNYMDFYPLADFSFDAEDNEDTNLILDNFYTSLDHELIDLSVDTDYCLLLKKSVDTSKIEREIQLYDTAQNGALGEIHFMYDGKQLGSTLITSTTPATGTTSLLTSQIMQAEHEHHSFFQSLRSSQKILLIAAIIIVALLLFFVIYLMYIAIMKRRNRRKINNRKRQRLRKKNRRNDDYYF